VVRGFSNQSLCQIKLESKFSQVISQTFKRQARLFSERREHCSEHVYVVKFQQITITNYHSKLFDCDSEQKIKNDALDVQPFCSNQKCLTSNK
jgi:hypothetical protein